MRSFLFKSGADIEHQVDYCKKATEAMQIIKDTYENDMSYKIIFLDYKMHQKMNGIQLAEKIRKHYDYKLEIFKEDQPKIIGLTEDLHDKFKIEGYEAGMNDVLGKPINIKILKSLLRQNVYINEE